MLDGLRKASGNWIGRTVMGLIMAVMIVSFAIWGIGPVFNGFGSGDVASVGSIHISADEYHNAYTNELEQMQQQAKRSITTAEAQALGLNNEVMGRLISDAALDDRANALGLAMADGDIAAAIAADPTFRGPTGKFDLDQFNSALQQSGYTEKTFVNEQRHLYLRHEIADAIAGAVTVPQAAVDAMHRYTDEVRSLDYVVLPESAAGDIPAPTADQLQKYYTDRQTAYRAPEYRKLVVLAVTPASVAGSIAVSDDDAMALYNQVKAQRFVTPEHRTLEQVVLPNDQAASDASTKIKAGASFDSVAGSGKVDLGSVAAADVVDKAVAQAAFALPEGGVSDPIKGAFGTVLVHVVKIDPAAVKPFADVEADLKKEVAATRSKAQVQTVHDTIEDARTSGKALTEAAQGAGQTVTIIDAVDATGNDKSGKPVQGLVEPAALLQAAFASDVGVDNDTLSTADGGYEWFEVSAVEPARQRTLDEVRADVTKGWHDDQVATLLSAKAADMVKSLDAGTTLDSLAAAQPGLTVQHAADAKRAGSESLPANVIAGVFNVLVGKSGSAEGAGLSRIVFQVLDSQVPPLDPESDASKKVEQDLRTAFGNDILGQYVGKLELDGGVRVNDAAMQQAISGGGPAGAGF